MSTIAQQSSESKTFDELIFKQDLAEVHLLLDFVSGRPDAHIWDLDVQVPKEPHSERILPPFEVIRRVCKLRYPPPPAKSIDEKAHDATLLLYVKDKLNYLARPARGLTISYTYIFVEDVKPLKIQTDSSKEKIYSRASVAKDAYPGIIDGAQKFRRFRDVITVAGGIIAFVSALILWIVVYGAQATSRFEENRKSELDITKQIYAQIDKEGARDKNLDGRSVAERCCITDMTDFDRNSSQIKLLCDDWSYIHWRYNESIYDVYDFANRSPSKWIMYLFPNSATADSAGNPSKHTEVACPHNGSNKATESEHSADRTNPSANLSEQAEGEGSIRPVNAPPPASGSAAIQKSPSSNSRPTDDNVEEKLALQENIQSVTLVLSAYTYYILPVLFGFLGTIAWLLRDIGNKITDSILSPRDARLAPIRLMLGAIAGIAVGLFFTPSSVATQITAGSGIVTVSASGIAFLAGYGADVFFRMVDAFVGHLFSAEALDKRH